MRSAASTSASTRARSSGLIGDNGAGKSTLIKILAGVVKPTSGEILVRGEPVGGWNAARSREAGIETVFQDRALAVQQSIVRNIFMGCELKGPLGWLNTGKEAREAERLMREIGFTSKVFAPRSIVGQLSGGERQGVAIARAIYRQADLIVLDEPTTALSLTETNKVFHFVRQARASGRSIVFIGHNIHHVYEIADRFVVLDRGKVELEAKRADVPSVEALIAFMEAVCEAEQGRRSRPPWGEGRDMTDAAQPENPGAEAADAARARHPLEHPVRRFIDANRAALGTFAVLVVMMAIFIAANPEVFLEWNIYRSVLTTLPVALFLVVPLVFVVTAGEIDLSFPSSMGFSAWMFALVVQAGLSPYLGLAAAMATGALLGFFVGSLVVYLRLSSLIATLGMNFMLRGVIQIVTQGKSIALVSLGQSSAKSAFSGVVFGVPTQMLWALAFVVFSSLLFNRNQFGAHVKIVGDNSDSAQQMGIDVNWVRVKAFAFVGLGAALAGFFSTMINFTWWPTSGDGYLLPALASVFVGGTPTWGGIGTVGGGAIGALIVSFIQTGIVGAGLERILRPVLQRAHHHPVPDRTPVEPDPIPVGRREVKP